MKWLSDDTLGDYEGFAKLAKLYRSLRLREQAEMAEGLASAIGDLEDPGVLADAIHLAHHLEIFTESVERAVESRKSLGRRDAQLWSEIETYQAYQAHPLPLLAFAS